MGLCISKPSPRHSLHLPPEPVPPAPRPSSVAIVLSREEHQSSEAPPSSVSEEGEIEPFSIVISDAPALSYSDSEGIDEGESYESASRLSLADWSGDIRDSLELIQLHRGECTYVTVENLRSEVARLTRELELLKNQPVKDIICVVCQSQLPKVLFRPCRHLCCCTHCARRVTACPMCRKAVHQREEVYF